MRIHPGHVRDDSHVVYVGYFEVDGVVMHDDKIAEGVIGECRKYTYQVRSIRQYQHCGIKNRRGVYLSQNRTISSYTNMKIYDLLNLYGEDAFKLEILHDNLTKSGSTGLERCYRPKDNMGLNKKQGGPRLGTKQSLEHSSKIRKSKTGIKYNMSDKPRKPRNDAGVKRGPHKKK